MKHKFKIREIRDNEHYDYAFICSYCHLKITLCEHEVEGDVLIGATNFLDCKIRKMSECTTENRLKNLL